MTVIRSCKALLVAATFALGAVSVTGAAARPPDASQPLKATLHNGLRVVIVRNPLAPVVSTDLVYLVGSRDDPAGVPGMAHAQEHMMFRGTKLLSTSELGTIATALGGNFNAQTSDTATQFQFTVPAADLDAVLRIESDRMHDVLDAQAQWQNERGAIEQEVLRDAASPGGDFFRDAQMAAFAGTPYAHEGVGTRTVFDRLTGPDIKAFYDRWYAPNNAVLVIAGDVDPAATLAQIRARFESIPAKTVPERAAVQLAPMRRVVFRRPTTLVYPLAAIGFRMPGVDSPDFLPSFVLQGILDSQRGPLHALVDSGEALDAEWVSMPYNPAAQLGFATAALGPGGDPSAMATRLQTILSDYAARGIPAELFTSTKRRLIADQELSRNSIEALASDWATTIALDREPSIAREQQLIGNVTLEDVNRVARRDLDVRHAIVGALTPSANASQNAAPAPPQQGPEKPLQAQAAVTRLPDWGQALVGHIVAPPTSLAPTQTKLPNGITLIVQPEAISDSVFLFGNVRTQPELQEPPGREGVSSVLDAMFDYGTQTQDRPAFERAQDDLDSTIAPGAGFALQSTSAAFDRAVTLLAQNELTPRLDSATLALARRRTVNEIATSLTSSAAIARRQAATKLLPPGDPELREPTVAGVGALTLDDVKAYYAKTMRPDLTTIVVVGNVTPQAARATVERAFGTWQATGPVPALDLPPVPLNASADVKLTLPATAQASVTFEQLVPLERSAPQFYPLQLGNAILGGGASGPEQSRLFRDLRQNAGLVYNIGSQFSAQRSRSRFSVAFACSPANVSRIGTLVDAEIEAMRHEPAGDFELSLVKASLVRRTIIGDSSVSTIGNSLLDNATHGYPLDQAQIDARHLIATDSRAVQEAFASYVHPQNFVRVIEGPQ